LGRCLGVSFDASLPGAFVDSMGRAAELGMALPPFRVFGSGEDSLIPAAVEVVFFLSARGAEALVERILQPADNGRWLH
jgi:hypothetical protein